jgi:hypothetical protein
LGAGIVNGINGVIEQLGRLWLEDINDRVGVVDVDGSVRSPSEEVDGVPDVTIVIFPVGVEGGDQIDYVITTPADDGVVVPSCSYN